MRKTTNETIKSVIYVDAVVRKKQIKEKLEKLKMNVETENKTNERTN